jgi:hypothetical protein
MKPHSTCASMRLNQQVRWMLLLAAIVVLTGLTGGCAEQSSDAPASAAAGKVSNNLQQTGPAIAKDSGNSQAKGGAEGRTETSSRKTAAARKIIYDARVDVLVDSLSSAEQAVLDLIKEHDGFLAESDQSSATSTRRTATWRVRVPVDQFSAFLSAVIHLGEVRQNHVGSQDVTEEYFDIEARIRNKQEEEKRLLKHLADSTGKLEDILAVERELSRVRGEVEQMQGRIRVLADRTALSTITIEATEWKDYKPPIAASFPTQLGRTFFNSVDNLAAFGKALATVIVALAPWLPFIIAGIFIARWLIRGSRGPARGKSLPVTPARPTAT